MPYDLSALLIKEADLTTPLAANVAKARQLFTRNAAARTAAKVSPFASLLAKARGALPGPALAKGPSAAVSGVRSVVHAAPDLGATGVGGGIAASQGALHGAGLHALLPIQKGGKLTSTKLDQLHQQHPHLFTGAGDEAVLRGRIGGPDVALRGGALRPQDEAVLAQRAARSGYQGIHRLSVPDVTRQIANTGHFVPPQLAAASSLDLFRARAPQVPTAFAPKTAKLAALRAALRRYGVRFTA